MNDEGIRMYEVESSNVEAIGFTLDNATAARLALAAVSGEVRDPPMEEAAVVGTMCIRFKGGRTYEYRNVPAFVYIMIANAPSVGSVVQLFKKGRFMKDYRQV